MTISDLVIKGSKGLKPLDKPLVMGIVNVTPDSFYPASRSQGIEQTLEKVSQMIDDGVDIIDIGGMSSRPGAEELTIDEEISRLLGPLEAVRKAYPSLWVSIDTYRTAVLEACLLYTSPSPRDQRGSRMPSSA